MPSYYETPTALLSSNDYYGKNSLFIHQGFHSILKKPFSREDLFEVISSVIAPITQEDKAAIDAAKKMAGTDNKDTKHLQYKAYLMGGKTKPKLRLISNKNIAA